MHKDEKRTLPKAKEDSVWGETPAIAWMEEYLVFSWFQTVNGRQNRINRRKCVGLAVTINFYAMRHLRLCVRFLASIVVAWKKILIT